MIRQAGLVLLLLFGACGAAADTALDTPLASHEACAAEGRESGVCAGMLTTYCLATSANLDELTGCRLLIADRLDLRTRQLMAELGAQGRRAVAEEVARGAARVVGEFCDRISGPRTRAPAHVARCAMLRAHVTVYHLIRAVRGPARDL